MKSLWNDSQRSNRNIVLFSCSKGNGEGMCGGTVVEMLPRDYIQMVAVLAKIKQDMLEKRDVGDLLCSFHQNSEAPVQLLAWASCTFLHSLQQKLQPVLWTVESNLHCLAWKHWQRKSPLLTRPKLYGVRIATELIFWISIIDDQLYGAYPILAFRRKWCKSNTLDSAKHRGEQVVAHKLLFCNMLSLRWDE